MMTLNLPATTLSRFSIVATLQEPAILVCLTGNADVDAHDALESFLLNLHAETLRISAPKVILDIQRLEIMDTSCFKSLVMWLGKVQDLRDNQYHIDVRTNPKAPWQSRIMHQFRTLAIDLITLMP